MKRLLLLLPMLLATPVTAQVRVAADPVVTRWVAAFRAQGGAEDGGMRVTGVRGEGQVLVLQIALEPSLPAAMNPETVVSVLAGGMCSEVEGGAYFTAGRSLRVEVSRGGAPVGSAAIDHCPGPIGEGYSAATFAAAMQPLVGRELGAGVTITGFRAEGQNLVVTMDGPAGWRRTASQAMLENAFLSGFCEGDSPDDSIFSNGLGVRVDTTDGGRDPVRGQIITTCPARPGGMR